MYNGEYKKTNKYYDKLDIFIERLKQENKLNILYPLLNHESPAVRLNTSVYLYDMFTEEAKTCLLRLTEEERFLGYDAMEALEVLKERYKK